MLVPHCLHTHHRRAQKSSSKAPARAAPKSRAPSRGRSERPPSQQANAPVTATSFSSRLEAASAGLHSLGIQWDPAQWVKESAALHAALDRGASARTSGKKGGPRTPTKKNAGKLLQAAVNDLDAAIKQWNAATLAIEQRTAQIAAGVFVVAPAASSSPRAAPEASTPTEGRRATKLPPKLEGFETDKAATSRARADEDTRGGKRQRKAPTWLAHHDVE